MPRFLYRRAPRPVALRLGPRLARFYPNEALEDTARRAALARGALFFPLVDRTTGELLQELPGASPEVPVRNLIRTGLDQSGFRPTRTLPLDLRAHQRMLSAVSIDQRRRSSDRMRSFSGQAFVYPFLAPTRIFSRAWVCAKRAIRREVLFALGQRRSSGRRRYRSTSHWRC